MFIEQNSIRIYVLYDPPHLLKKVSDNLKIIITLDKWQWYNLVSQRKNEPAFSTMKVNLATQVHSHSVFAGISGMCDIGISAENNRSTAVFIKQIIPLVLSKTIFCC